ncbi:hypothetical protein NX059_009384 [Plenodomus lindquistii]|nr:hypothetical protein NX059_009384 [Plenodomus lindquistii]
MLLPGTFTILQHPTTPPKLPKSALRIAQIYVSQRTTMYNGRLNWNIPKHLARFSFSAPPTLAGQSPPASLRVQVFPPTSSDGDGVCPFFESTLKIVEVGSCAAGEYEVDSDELYAGTAAHPRVGG